MKSQTEYEWDRQITNSYFCPINKSCNTKVQRIALYYIWRLLKVNNAIGILYVCLLACISKISYILTYIFRLLCMSSIFTSFFLSLSFQFFLYPSSLNSQSLIFDKYRYICMYIDLWINKFLWDYLMLLIFVYVLRDDLAYHPW